MDQIKIGKFISEVRKEQNLTQEQLAEQLAVSKNAVSKWERGCNLPDASLMLKLCHLLEISLNELFAGERLQEQESIKQSEKNLLNLFSRNFYQRKKYRLWMFVSLFSLLCGLILFGRILFIKCGYIMDPTLRYSQIYIVHEGNIQGEVDINRFGKIHIDFDIGANKYGVAVFKHPQKAWKRLKKDYDKGIKRIQKEFHLLPLTHFTYQYYKTYGWQVTTGTEEEKNQAHFVSQFIDIYENSFHS